MKQCAVCPAEATGDSDRCAAHAQPAQRQETVTFDEGTEFVQHRRATRPRHSQAKPQAESWGGGPTKAATPPQESGATPPERAPSATEADGNSVLEPRQEVHEVSDEEDPAAPDSDDELLEATRVAMKNLGDPHPWEKRGQLVSGTTIDSLGAVLGNKAAAANINIVSAGAFETLIRDMLPGKKFARLWKGKNAIVVPIHLLPEGSTGHWVLAVVYPDAGLIVCYDSLPGYAAALRTAKVARLADMQRWRLGSLSSLKTETAQSKSLARTTAGSLP